jgi:hypothetical protein
MTTITLGSGPDAVEVEDGAAVAVFKITDASMIRTTTCGVLFEHHGIALLRVGTTICNVKRSDGTTAIPGWWQVDLDALRRERAPKPVTIGCWGIGVPVVDNHYTSIYCLREPSDRYPDYWTLRPDNTPEKQAAFDAALEAWLPSASIREECAWTQDDDLAKAARALGYGRR